VVAIDIRLNGDGAMQDWVDEGREVVVADKTLRVMALAGGMTSGKPSVGFGMLLPDGRVVFAETSLALFLAAADAMKARYGDPRRSGN
jgi:hypothetical protein